MAASASNTWRVAVAAATSFTQALAVEEIPELVELPTYDILNGSPEDVAPYLQRSTVPIGYQWCPVGGAAPEDCVKLIDAFIKSALYHIHANPPGNRDDAAMRKIAIILGTARAVMTANYRLVEASLIPGELGKTYINVTRTPESTFTYNIVAPPNPITPATAEGAEPVVNQLSRYLTQPLNLTVHERNMVTLVVKMAVTLVPLQGHNLLVDGHHYLSVTTRQSFRACNAVERQVIVAPEGRDWFDLTNIDSPFRDALWHKAGHPINVSIKYAAATSQRVAASLVNMNLGSAAARLPALESDARPISAFYKLTSVVKGVFEAHGGEVDNRIFEDVSRALEIFPIGAATVPDPANPSVARTFTLGAFLVEGNEVVVRNRVELMAYIKALVPRVQDSVAIAYGFYMGMVDNAQMMGDSVGPAGESLSKAYSLAKLKSECMASYAAGRELFADYRAMRQKKRMEGTFSAPRLSFY